MFFLFFGELGGTGERILDFVQKIEVEVLDLSAWLGRYLVTCLNF